MEGDVRSYWRGEGIEAHSSQRGKPAGFWQEATAVVQCVGHLWLENTLSTYWGHTLDELTWR